MTINLEDLYVKSIRGWAIFSYKNHDLLWWTIAPTRRDAVCKIVENYRAAWVDLKKEGYTVEKISITPLEQRP